MKKNFKKYFYLYSAPILPLAILSTQISADTTESKPTVKTDEDLFALNEQIKTMVSNRMESLIEIIDDLSRAKIESIKSDDNIPEIDKIVGEFYYNKVRAYYKDNLEDIKNNWSKYGIHVIFPFVYGQNKNINLGIINWNNNDYATVSYGSYKKPTNYEILNDFGGYTATKKDEKINEADLDFAKEVLDSYFEQLYERVSEIFLNEEDKPLYKQNVLVNINVKNPDIFDVSKPSNIEGLETWEEYIYHKISKRFLHFDLDVNRSVSSDVIQEIPEIPEVQVDDEEPVKINEQDSVLPVNLKPWKNLIYKNFDADQLIEAFNSAETAEEKQKVFFFTNPIPTRWKYNVISLTKSETGINATISLEDSVLEDEQSARSYTTSVEGLGTDSQTFIDSNMVYFSNEIIKKTINELLINLDIPIEFDKDKFQKSIAINKNNINNFIFAITKILTFPKFTGFYQFYIDKYSKDTIENLNSSVINVQKEIQNLFIDYLKTTKINNDSLTRYFYKLLNQRSNNLNKALKANTKILDEFLDKSNVKWQKLAKISKYRDDRLGNLESLIREKWINNIGTFNSFIQQAEKVNKSYNLLNDFNELLAPDSSQSPEEIQKFENSVIKNLNDFYQEITQTNRNIIWIFLALFMFISTLIIASFVKVKKIVSNTKTKNKVYIFIGSIVIISILAVVTALLTTLLL